jgi:hypothetical protein
MAGNASIGTMIAAAALIAWPVLAQTTSGPGAGNAAPPSPGMTTTRPARPGLGSTGPATTSTSSAPKYFTADHQVRAGKVVGASVHNDQNQAIVSVDDSKLVSVPFDQLKIENGRIVMPGATKASLEGMPEYRYTSA